MNNKTDNQKVLGNCPSCQRLMQIPVVTNVASVAKCPHCQQEVPVRDLLASAVPEAEIIVKDTDKKRVSEYIADRQRVYDDDSHKTREKFEVPNQLYNGASRRNRKRRVGSKGASSRSSSSRDSSSRSRSGKNGSSENAQAGNPNSIARVSSNDRTSKVDPSRDSNGSSQSTNVASTNVASTSGSKTVTSSTSATSSSAATNAAQVKRTPKPVPRPQRSSSRGRRSDELDDEVEFGIAEVVKFAIGGLIAAPLAYLALLWVVGVDPFGMASTFESVSPAIIPDSLRSESFSEEPRSGFSPPTGESSSLMFGTNEDEFGIEDEGLPLPSLDPDLVR